MDKFNKITDWRKFEEEKEENQDHGKTVQK